MDKDINMLLMVLMKVPCEITDDNEDCNVLEKRISEMMVPKLGSIITLVHNGKKNQEADIKIKRCKQLKQEKKKYNKGYKGGYRLR